MEQAVAHSLKFDELRTTNLDQPCTSLRVNGLVQTFEKQTKTKGKGWRLQMDQHNCSLLRNMSRHIICGFCTLLCLPSKETFKSLCFCVFLFGQPDSSTSTSTTELLWKCFGWNHPRTRPGTCLPQPLAPESSKTLSVADGDGNEVLGS